MTVAGSSEAPGAPSDRRATKDMSAVHHDQRRRRVAGFILLGLIPATLAACAWVRTQAPSAEALPHLVWPEPPDRARVDLVAVFARASDLGIERAMWRRLASLITGGGEVQMVRPAGLAAAGARIAVADPGA